MHERFHCCNHHPLRFSFFSRTAYVKSCESKNTHSGEKEEAKSEYKKMVPIFPTLQIVHTYRGKTRVRLNEKYNQPPVIQCNGNENRELKPKKWKRKKRRQALIMLHSALQ